MGAPVVKGLYIQSALDVVTRASGAAAAEEIRAAAALPAKLSTLRDYPQHALSHVVKLAAAKCFPGVDDNEVVRRFGAAAFEAFAQTIIGKVGVGLARVAQPQQVGRAVARMHNAATRSSTVEALDLSERGFRLRYRGCVHAWYQLGMTEAAFAGSSPPAAVSLDVVRHAVNELWMPALDCEFDLVVRAVA